MIRDPRTTRDLHLAHVAALTAADVTADPDSVVLDATVADRDKVRAPSVGTRYDTHYATAPDPDDDVFPWEYGCPWGAA